MPLVLLLAQAVQCPEIKVGIHPSSWTAEQTVTYRLEIVNSSMHPLNKAAMLRLEDRRVSPPYSVGRSYLINVNAAGRKQVQELSVRLPATMVFQDLWLSPTCRYFGTFKSDLHGPDDDLSYDPLPIRLRDLLPRRQLTP